MLHHCHATPLSRYTIVTLHLCHTAPLSHYTIHHGHATPWSHCTVVMLHHCQATPFSDTNSSDVLKRQLSVKCAYQNLSWSTDYACKSTVKTWRLIALTWLGARSSVLPIWSLGLIALIHACMSTARHLRLYTGSELLMVFT